MAARNRQDLQPLHLNSNYRLRHTETMCNDVLQRVRKLQTCQDIIIIIIFITFQLQIHSVDMAGSVVSKRVWCLVISVLPHEHYRQTCGQTGQNGWGHAGDIRHHQCEGSRHLTKQRAQPNRRYQDTYWHHKSIARASGPTYRFEKSL